MSFRIGLITVLAFGLMSCTNNNGSSPETMSSQDFIEEANAQIKIGDHSTNMAAWIQTNFITQDTTRISSEYSARFSEMVTGYALQSKNYTPENADQKRMLNLMQKVLTVPPPADSEKNSELALLKSELESIYGSGKYCEKEGQCEDLGDLEKVISKSRNPKELLRAWDGWRTVSAPMKDKYKRTVEIGNEGSKDLGFKDLADLWRSKYDMPAADFEKELDRIWSEVKPFYEQLHCYVRGKLNAHYGDKVVKKEGPIPAHLLGNMWAQSWENIADIVGVDSSKSVDITALLKKANYDSKKMVKTAENFFVSLDMPTLPATFYERSLFEKPRDRDVVCHASAWHINMEDDVRIKMCIEINEDNFRTIHHELGHIYYYLAYKDLPPLYQSSANDGFHEALGDTIELSITADYLNKIKLLDRVPASTGEVDQLLRMALTKVAFLPFGLMIDKWRWQVFDGRVPPQ
ncbi:MAG: M2 family metallopeptidase, partial [Bdellovibrionales bacterium]|nr:M2 family metallopeptidase [Bdellovibrionales bacterium]NQZ19379.1 M2 family metallopeptidase [Bdellovibrionales bacterium]